MKCKSCPSEAHYKKVKECKKCYSKRKYKEKKSRFLEWKKNNADLINEAKKAKLQLGETKNGIEGTSKQAFYIEESVNRNIDRRMERIIEVLAGILETLK